jgi:hypothetical protein
MQLMNHLYYWATLDDFFIINQPHLLETTKIGLKAWEKYFECGFGNKSKNQPPSNILFEMYVEKPKKLSKRKIEENLLSSLKNAKLSPNDTTQMPSAKKTKITSQPEHKQAPTSDPSLSMSSFSNIMNNINKPIPTFCSSYIDLIDY